MAVNLKTLTEEELFYGAKTCQGCGALMACRMAMKAIGPNSCVAIPACCMSATTTVFPQSSLFVNNAVTAFPALASTISGMSVGGEVMGWDEDTTFVAFGGDGGTVDIGIQALSGAAERNDNIIYICYDNDAYMNTGVQRSGSTPHYAWTTTTPTGPCSKGENNTHRKSLLEIMAAHRIPYAATASVAYPMDLLNKVAKAKSYRGCRVLHIMAPCPTGWGYDPARTVELGKMAVESGMWYLAEYENDEMHLTVTPKELKPVDDYLKCQRRFRHLKPEDIEEISKIRDDEWKRLERVFNIKR
jgi:pyruvate ferredoxin oxidoreductase beta subunit